MEHTKEDRQHTEDSIESLKEQITKLESKLSNFEEQKRIWGEVMEEGLFIHEDFIITVANSALSRISGYPTKELIGMHGKELLTDTSFELMKKYALSNEESEIELEMITKDGKSKYLYTKGKTFKAGDKTQRAVIVQDITGIKEAQKSLKDSEQKYKSLVDNVDIGIGISKGERILFANTALLSIYGLKTIEELASKKLTDYMPLPSKKLVKERIRKYKLKEKQDNVFRHDIIRSDGKKRTLELETSEVIYEGENCRQVLMKDITRELENETALKQAANIFNNTQLGLFIYRLDNLNDDYSLRMMAVNPASIQLVGLTSDEMIGKTIDEIFPNLRKKRIPQQYAEVIRSQIPIAFDDIYYEDNRVTPDFFSVKVFPLPNQCVGISFENVSERRKTEQELRDKNQELNDFVYKVSHDLRAPLNSIKGLINLSKIEEKTNEYTPKMEERIDYLNGFIRDILSHSRNLNVAIIIEKVDLEKMIKDWLSELEHIPNSKLIKKDIEISGLDFYSDKTRLSEIIRNLVSNAIKYHDLSKDNKFLRVKGEVDKNLARITFEDNGIGIRSEFIDRIYNMFYRATDFAEGTGIGLYIVKEAIGKLNGNIEVSSQHGHGTTFTIEIPNMISQKES